MSDVPLLPLGVWVPILDGDPLAAALYAEHYSSERSRERRARRGTMQFVGPGNRMVLMTPCRRAMWAWRRQKYRADAQSGVECSIFVNRGAGIASDLIRAADSIADARWPGQRHFTFINPARVRGTPPGNCFRRAGWRECHEVSSRGLIVLERESLNV